MRHTLFENHSTMSAVIHNKLITHW